MGNPSNIDTPNVNTGMYNGLTTPVVTSSGINTVNQHNVWKGIGLDAPGIDTPEIEDHESSQSNKSRIYKSPGDFTNSSSKNTPQTPSTGGNPTPGMSKTPPVRFKKKSIIGKVTSGIKS